MTVTKRVMIRLEKERTMRIHHAVQTQVSKCRACNTSTDMLPAQEAALLAGISLLNLFRRVEAGQLHHEETPDGQLFICLHSLL
jgi:hypothetical protein